MPVLNYRVLHAAMYTHNIVSVRRFLFQLQVAFRGDTINDWQTQLRTRD